VSPLRSFLSHAVFAVAIAAGMMGCKSEYDRTVITAGSRPSPFPGHVTEESILVTNGTVTTAHIVSYNDDDNIMTMNVRAVDPTVLDVSNVISDHDFAFVGLKVGTTDVEIRADDKVVLVISASVVAQPAP
jgi:hypothetical protein